MVPYNILIWCLPVRVTTLYLIFSVSRAIEYATSSFEICARVCILRPNFSGGGVRWDEYILCGRQEHDY